MRPTTEALNAFQLLSKLEGIIPALESAPCHRQGCWSFAPKKPEGSPDGGQSSGRGD
jgi:tryptophan synthase beta subunit